MQILGGTTTVSVHNGSQALLTILAAPFHYDGCTGWLRVAEVPRDDVAAGASITVAVRNPGWGWPLRIGVDIWTHECRGDCQDQPDGFAWFDVPEPPTH